MKIAYHVSHEQFAPSLLLALVHSAEAAGFDAAFSSDHFHPWSERQAQSGFSWAWLGAAMQATAIPYGMICAPSPRYHPAVVAQAAATLAEMFPGRFWMAVGSGQLLNEGITGEPWPLKSVRNARLREAVEVIRALWAGQTVTHHGLVRVEEARLYTRPARPPLLLGAAITAETAGWLASWADGLLTIARPREELLPVLEAFRSGGGEGKPIRLKVQLSFARTDEEALRGAWEQWRGNIFDSHIQAELRTPAHFDALARHVNPEDLRPHVRISSDPRRHLEWLREDTELGVDQLILHNVNNDQRRFIEAFSEHVLPVLGGEGSSQ